MAWTLVGLVARAGRTLGVRRAALSASIEERAQRVIAHAADRPDVAARACVRRLQALSAADRRAVEVAFEAFGSDSPVVERAMASGAPVPAVAALAAAWETIDPGVRAVVRHPLGARRPGPVTWDGIAATQVDQTTCGAASMAMMLMMGDPLVAAWVASGRRGGWYLPPEPLEAVVAADAVGHGLHTVRERWDALQRVMHARVSRHGLGLAPWPRSLGTAPWRIDNVTRYSGLRFRGVLVDDERHDEIDALATQVRAALADGIPVPLYAAGDSQRGWSTVVPRHVVLVVDTDGDSLVVYEPSSGALHRWHPTTASASRQAALGGWNRVVWAILPRWRG